MERSTNFFRTQLAALLAIALTMPACNAQLELGPTTRISEEAPASRFTGDWGYATDCNFGHYVGLTLQAQSGVVTGVWSDGTNVRGSQGKLRGTVHDGKLSVQWCSDADEAGGYPLCPTYSQFDGYLVRRGDELVWMRDKTEYVALTRGESTRRAQEECQD